MIHRLTENSIGCLLHTSTNFMTEEQISEEDVNGRKETVTKQEDQQVLSQIGVRLLRTATIKKSLLSNIKGGIEWLNGVFALIL